MGRAAWTRIHEHSMVFDHIKYKFKARSGHVGENSETTVVDPFGKMLVCAESFVPVTRWPLQSPLSQDCGGEFQIGGHFLVDSIGVGIDLREVEIITTCMLIKAP